MQIHFTKPGNNYNNQNTRYKYRNITFNGKINTLARQLAKEPWYVRWSTNFSQCGGEKLANIINSAGKFAIAPLIIAFNPFSREDKDTKFYSAWKQPIEAAVTIVAQLIALNRLDKYVDKLAETAQLAPKFNLKGLTDKKAIELTTERLGVFKDRLGFVVALALIPITTSFVNWIYPKIMKKILPHTYDEGGKKP